MPFGVLAINISFESLILLESLVRYLLISNWFLFLCSRSISSSNEEIRYIISRRLLLPWRWEAWSLAWFYFLVGFPMVLYLFRPLSKFCLSILSWEMITLFNFSFWWVRKCILWFIRLQRVASKSSSENSESWTFLFSVLNESKLNFQVMRSIYGVEIFPLPLGSPMSWNKHIKAVK